MTTTCGDEGSSCHEACDCTRERYRREGAAEERARVVAALNDEALALDGRALLAESETTQGWLEAMAHALRRFLRTLGGEHVKGGG
jgi:hypothetical protein